MYKIVINIRYGGFGLSDKAVQMLNCIHDDNDNDHYWGNRDCESLVKVVEELGTDANGCESNLKVISIPDELKNYHKIYNFDGLERLEIFWRDWLRDIHEIADIKKVLKELDNINFTFGKR